MRIIYNYKTQSVKRRLIYMTISELREKTGMNRKLFCEYFDIPYRTVSDWESGERKCSDYLVRALYYE